MNSLWKELREILDSLETERPPVLRRNLREEWLYASDLPSLCDGGQTEAAESRLRRRGWVFRTEEGWIQLRKPGGEPPEGWYGGRFLREARCCLSLLERHPERSDEPPEREAILLIKAGESGEAAYEEACGKLHRDWAARLREGRGLPAISKAYFGA